MVFCAHPRRNSRLSLSFGDRSLYPSRVTSRNARVSMFADRVASPAPIRGLAAQVGVLLAVITMPALLAACSAPGTPPPEHPGITFPVDIASGHQEPSGAETSETARTSPPAARMDASASNDENPRGPPLNTPDPVPLRSAIQYEYTMLYERGVISVESVEARHHASAQVTARRAGRWALELCVGRELLERVRFDFPLLAGEKPQTSRQAVQQPPSFAPGAVVRRQVSLPENDRATFARLVDRETGEVTVLPWPPEKVASVRPAQHGGPGTGNGTGTYDRDASESRPNEQP